MCLTYQIAHSRILAVAVAVNLIDRRWMAKEMSMHTQGSEPAQKYLIVVGEHTRETLPF
jgi:hypothetical protein